MLPEVRTLDHSVHGWTAPRQSDLASGRRPTTIPMYRLAAELPTSPPCRTGMEHLP